MYSKPCDICKTTKDTIDFGNAVSCPNCFPVIEDIIPAEAIQKVLEEVQREAARRKYKNFN